MTEITLPRIGTAKAWRKAARTACAAGIPPEAISWRHPDRSADLFACENNGQQIAPADPSPLTVPRDFLALATAVCCHRDPARFALLYAVLWRLRREKRLLEDASDEQVAKLRRMEKSVRRDSHKMKAFVRFREISGDNRRRCFGAWFEPDHYIEEFTAPFFIRRFAEMDWAIATPNIHLCFKEGSLAMRETVERPDFGADATEDLWRTYFANVFNPGRVKLKAMRAEMPKKYWKNLPEAALIPELVASAAATASAMYARPPGTPPRRAGRIRTMHAAPAETASQGPPETLAELAAEAAACTRCPLYKNATQTVFGAGPKDAPIMFVGEQPGDREDLAGEPFVGPAGQLFDTVLGETGIDRGRCYVTNAVKHFKFEPRGKRRLHKRPDRGEVAHCRWWLERETRLIKPRLIVALGATAALALTGNSADVTRRRGSLETGIFGATILITIHPSAILRIPDRQAAKEARAAFRADLEEAARQVPEIRRTETG